MLASLKHSKEGLYSGDGFPEDECMDIMSACAQWRVRAYHNINTDSNTRSFLW